MDVMFLLLTRGANVTAQNKVRLPSASISPHFAVVLV
jgi:hypothetical protein